MENQISKVEQEIHIDEIYNLEEVIANFLKFTEHVYSYLVYVNYKGECINSYTVQYNISQVDKYNTLSISKVTSEVCDIIRDNYINFQKLNVKYIIGYNQPSVELILKLYDPFVKSIAKKQKEQWQSLSYEDLCQDCRLVICMLYNKGYYIHKRLVEKSFNNLVLMSIRKDIDKPNIVSLDDVFNQFSNEGELTIKDVIADERQLEQQYDNDCREAEESMFRELKQLIINEIGERGFEQLLKNYGSKNTDEWSRYTVRKLKDKFRKKGTYELLKNKYN